MSTPISVDLEFAASVDQVYAMLSDTSYLDAKCAPAISSSHTVTLEGQFTTIQVMREMPLPANIPDIARSIVGETLKLTETQRWDSSGQHPTGTLSIVVIQGTAEVNGSMSLSANGKKTILQVTADIMVRVPLFGASLERSISGSVESVLHEEEKIGQAWLAAHAK